MTEQAVIAGNAVFLSVAAALTFLGVPSVPIFALTVLTAIDTLLGVTKSVCLGQEVTSQ